MLTAPVKWVLDWLAENPFGASFHSIEELGYLLGGNELEEFRATVRLEASRFSIEYRIGALERFLAEVSGG